MADESLHKFVNIPIGNLKLAEYNPRTIDEDNEKALRASLQADPEMLYDQPIVVNMYPGREGVVYIGNQRVKVAQSLGWNEVPVLLSSVDPIEEKKRNVKANHHNGQFDQELLSGILVELADSGLDMGSLGYTAVDLTSAMDFETLDVSQDPEYNGTAGRQPKEHTCPSCGYTWKDGQGAQAINAIAEPAESIDPDPTANAVEYPKLQGE